MVKEKWEMLKFVYNVAAKSPWEHVSVATKLSETSVFIAL